MRALITGGAGFIGSNLADRLLARGDEVTIYDNLTRPGAIANLRWLEESHGKRLRFIYGDVRDMDRLWRAVRGAQVIYHLASQVAVTTSVADPRTDFEVNALGTFNALEAARLLDEDPVFLYSSTNKVYGAMEDVGIVEQATRYAYADLPGGVPETQPLDFHSPYGCSKGAADQYVRDYARIYGLRTVVFRQSCIYGPRQFGVEDQGWVAWFTIAAALGRPVTVYGDGKQVRDLLYVEDLLDAYDAAVANIDVARGRVYNLGGGPANTVSVWFELGQILRELAGRDLQVEFGPWRPGDQRVFISDTSLAGRELGWRPKVSVPDGVGRLYSWIERNRELFA